MKKQIAEFNELTSENAREKLELDMTFSNVHDVRVEKRLGKKCRLMLVLQFDIETYTNFEDLDDFAIDNDFTIEYLESVENRLQVTLERVIAIK